MDERLDRALGRLAGLFEYGHLQMDTDPASFIDDVIERIESETAQVQAIRLILSKIERRGEVPDTCECDGCLGVIRETGEKTCHRCGYHGRFAAIACVCDEICDPIQASSASCPHGALKCPVCEDGEADVDPWRYLRAIQMAMRGEPTQAIGKMLRGEPDEEASAC